MCNYTLVKQSILAESPSKPASQSQPKNAPKMLETMGKDAEWNRCCYCAVLQMHSVIILTVVGSFYEAGMDIVGRTNSSVVRKCSLWQGSRCARASKGKYRMMIPDILFQHCLSPACGLLEPETVSLWLVHLARLLFSKLFWCLFWTQQEEQGDKQKYDIRRSNLKHWKCGACKSVFQLRQGLRCDESTRRGMKVRTWKNLLGSRLKIKRKTNFSL